MGQDLDHKPVILNRSAAEVKNLDLDRRFGRICSIKWGNVAEVSIPRGHNALWKARLRQERLIIEMILLKPILDYTEKIRNFTTETEILNLALKKLTFWRAK